MANIKYHTVDDVVGAIRNGSFDRRSVSQMIQYYKKKGDDRWKIYKKALLLTDPVFDE